MVRLTINDKTYDIDARVEPDTPLLWAIRENIGLTGTKYGCGIAQCGACTVHVDGSCNPLMLVPRQRRGRHRRSPPSKVSPRMAFCIRCRRPGSNTTSRNAATANPARSWPRWNC